MKAKVGDKIQIKEGNYDNEIRATPVVVTSIKGNCAYFKRPSYCNGNVELVIAEDNFDVVESCNVTVGKFGHPTFYKLLDEMAELHSRKNHDYAGTKDPLRNLKSAERLGIDPFLAVLVRLQDKWSRLESLAQTDPLVKGESIEDTLMDNAVYSLLAIILLREKKEKQCLTSTQISES
jgi:hypothetical protein